MATWLLLLSLGAVGPGLQAAQIKAVPAGGGGDYVVSISGTIQSGDSERLARTLARVTRVREIRLASSGGDVVESVLMGEIIRPLRLPTVVAADATCASACFFLWLNGGRRQLSEGRGRLGVHRPALAKTSPSEGSRTAQANLLRAVTGYLEARRVPRKFIDLMMSHPLNQFYWLSNADVLELGVIPPELEELYRAQCHDSTGELAARRRAAQRSHDAQAVQDLSARMSALRQCQAALDDMARAEAVRQLRGGWRPPPPFLPGK